MNKWLCLLCLVLAGCASSPRPDFYLLSADAASATASNAELSIGLASVTVAAYLDRSPIVTLDDANRLQINDYHRWAEPVRDGVRRVLVLNLASLLGTEQVGSMPWPRSEVPQWVLRVNLERLDVTANRIDLIAAWRLEDGESGQLVLSRMSHIDLERTASSVQAVAADSSEALRVLSLEIADGITAVSQRD